MHKSNVNNTSHVYKIKGDCDLTIGNIDFDGSVHISGGVSAGRTIKATGSIVIAGVAEAATLIAGGDVEMKSGMQGAGKGKIRAGGSVTALYIERGHVVADGSITLDASIHSVLEAETNIIAKGRRGAIIGGKAFAAGYIAANYLGAVSNTKTEIAVGLMKNRRDRIKDLEKDIETISDELIKLNQLKTYLEKAKEKIKPERWHKLHEFGEQTKWSCMENLEDCKAECEKLKYELDKTADSKVHVRSAAFAGSHISIGLATYKISNEISFTTFKYRNGKIAFFPYELHP